MYDVHLLDDQGFLEQVYVHLLYLSHHVQLYIEEPMIKLIAPRKLRDILSSRALRKVLFFDICSINIEMYTLDIESSVCFVCYWFTCS